jgi:RNA polymerase sigma-70 factor (ECF subfamily)
LIERYEGRLLAYVERRLHDRSASEDVVQETFIGFLTSLPNFDDNRELQSYLFTIASYKLTDHLRKTGRHPLQNISNNPGDPLNQELDKHAAVSSLARSFERKELESQAVERSLGQLIEKWREKGDYVRIKVIELLFVKGWPNRRVASELEIDEQKVANYRFATVRKLNEEIRGLGMSPDVFPELHESAG